MKSKVMGVDAANRRKNESSGVRGKAAGGAGAGASSKASIPTSRPMSSQGTFLQGSPPAHMMSGSKDKAPPRRTAKAEIKGYLSKVAREDRETEKSNYKTLDRAMGGADAKAIKQDLKAARQDKMSKSSAPSKSPRPMRSPVKKAGGGMIGYKDGGCVMSGRGGKYKGEM